MKQCKFLKENFDVKSTARSSKGNVSIYLSFHTATTPRKDYVQVDCDLKFKCKNRKKRKLKGDSVKIAGVEFRNVKNSCVVVL